MACGIVVYIIIGLLGHILRPGDCCIIDMIMEIPADYSLKRPVRPFCLKAKH